MAYTKECDVYKVGMKIRVLNSHMFYNQINVGDILEITRISRTSIRPIYCGSYYFFPEEIAPVSQNLFHFEIKMGE